MLSSRPSVSDPAASQCCPFCGGPTEATPHPYQGGDTPILPGACTAATPAEDRPASEIPPSEGILPGPPAAALPGPRQSVNSSSCHSSGLSAVAEETSLEVLFDGNKQARGLSFMDVGTTEVSPNGRSVSCA